MKKRLQKILTHSIAILACAIILFPILWLIPSAFKGKKEIFSPPLTVFPKTFTLDNFRNVFNLYDLDFGASLTATLGVAATATVLSLIINMCAAYGLARFEFPFKRILWPIILVTMFIPGITILLTSIRVVGALRLLDTFTVLVVPGLANAYNIFFFRQFFFSFPDYLEEAPLLDGLSRAGTFTRIFVPMSTTPMVIIGAGVFMGYWNSFLWPTMTITQKRHLMQVMQFIRELNSAYGANDFGVIIAATLIALIIPLIIFSFAQKHIMQGIAITGLK